MSDSDDSEIDVCSIDESTALNMHTGLTLVAAETYISTSKEEPEFPVPLTDEDLLTKTKQRKILEAKRKKIVSSLNKLKNNANSNKQKTVPQLITQEEKIGSKHESKTTRNEKTIEHHFIPQNQTDGISCAASESVDSSSMEPDGSILDEKLTSNQPNPVNNEDFLLSEEQDDEDEAEENSDDEILDSGVDNMLNQFLFESDHMAIKNNEDYHTLLQTLTVLEAQRVQAIKDLERLKELKEEALKDPLKFVQNLQDKKCSNMPQRQKIADLPEINWLHYMTAYSGDKLMPSINTRKSTKFAETAINEDFDMDDVEEVDIVPDNNNKKGKSDSHPMFKQKWTAEEQEKLEKLLILYPPEEVEKRRWEKIAKALGNRTPLQVCSRTQKYFLKLAKANLPIPGRVPTSAALHQQKREKGTSQDVDDKNQVKSTLANLKSSSFFPAWQPPVTMKDEEMDDDQDSAFNTAIDQPQTSEVDETPEMLRDTPEYREMMELKAMKKQIIQKKKKVEKNGPITHPGFMCDGCNMDPIVGVRWHCHDCPPQQSVDFCNNCAQRNFANDTHLKSHELQPINEQPDSHVDDDYLTFEQRNRIQYNYLDPNFLPNKTKTA